MNRLLILGALAICCVGCQDKEYPTKFTKGEVVSLKIAPVDCQIIDVYNNRPEISYYVKCYKPNLSLDLGIGDDSITQSIFVNEFVEEFQLELIDPWMKN